MRRTIRAASIAALSAGALSAQDAATVRREVRAYREAREPQIVREFADLLAIPNVASDAPNIRRNAEQIKLMLERRGLAAQILENDGHPPAVFAELRTPGATRTVVFYAHYDGQPVTPADWTTPPWQVTLRDKALFAGGKPMAIPTTGRIDPEARLYARGASDDKAPIVAMLTAIDALRAAKRAPSVNLKFFFEGEEEAGSEHLLPILQRYASLLTADAWVICDGPVHQSRKQQVTFGVRGVVGFEATVYGPTRPLHDGHYGNWAPNPAVLIADLVRTLRDTEGRILIPNFYDDMRPLSPAERRAVQALPSPDASLRDELGLAATEAENASLAERILLPALNVRGIRVGQVGDEGVNAIPTEARASFDFRLVPDETPARVKSMVEAFLRSKGWWVTNDSVTVALRRAHPKIVRLQWGEGYPGYRASMDLPVSDALIRSVSATLGEAVIAVPALGGSLPMHPMAEALKVPLINLPIANHDNNQHGKDENIRLQNLWDGIEVIAGVFVGLGKEWRTIP